MAVSLIIKKNQYYDSVFLMGVNQRLSEAQGVSESAVLMASEANKQTLVGMGIHDPRLEAAQPNDLVVVVASETQKVADDLLEHFDQFLEGAAAGKGRSSLHTLQDGLDIKPNANLAVISVPGEYAAREARLAVEHGLNVFLFSNNVSLEDEIQIKRLAQERGVLVMGPDCGTSIINGVGIGFANRVRQGHIGVIGPSGTGLQEFTCLVHHLGSGISHAIGTGSRDLSDQVGGVTTLAALQALEKDSKTAVITILSKPLSQEMLATLKSAFSRSAKPIVACFLGIQEDVSGAGEYFRQARTIDEAAALAIRMPAVTLEDPDEAGLITELKLARKPEQKYLRGVFAGGTFCYQSQQILQAHHIEVWSNSPIDKRFNLPDPDRSRNHTLVDMGDDIYTRGRPHPMIDGSQRSKRILAEAQDSTVAVILLDFILGYNSSMDPVNDLLPAIHTAQQIAARRGAKIVFAASITGTELDPQGYETQEKALRDAGVKPFHSNAAATEFCAKLLEM